MAGEGLADDHIHMIYTWDIIKFKIFSKIWKGRGADLGKCSKNVKIIVILMFSGTF